MRATQDRARQLVVPREALEQAPPQALRLQSSLALRPASPYRYDILAVGPVPFFVLGCESRMGPRGRLP